MGSFLVCFRAVAPIFLMMALGYVAQRTGAITREDVPRLNKLAFRYFMSVTMFNSIYHSDVSQIAQPKTLIFSMCSVAVVYGACVAFVLLTEKDPQKRGVKIQGMYRSNFVLIGLPLASALVEGADLGPVVLLVAVVVPLFNVLAVVTLDVFQGKHANVGHLLLGIIKNPLILGTAVGLVFLLTGLRLPHVLESTVEQISGISTPLMLFLLGAFFRFDGLSRYWKDLVQVCMARLVVIPGLALSAAWLAGIRGVVFAGMVGIFGSATAVASFTMVQQMGGDDELAGYIVVSTSALCVVTLFLWSFLFKTIGAF